MDQALDDVGRVFACSHYTRLTLFVRLSLLVPAVLVAALVVAPGGLPGDLLRLKFWVLRRWHQRRARARSPPPMARRPWLLPRLSHPRRRSSCPIFPLT